MNQWFFLSMNGARSTRWGVIAMLAAVPAVVAAGNPCNPCASAPGNPCAAGNRVDPKLIVRPPGTHLFAARREDLVKEGQALWNSKTLSTNGLSCQACHQNHGAFKPGFAQPYPHMVDMAAQRAGLKTIALDEMVQLCMVAPMASKPLPWNSRELAALTAYTADVQKSFSPHPVNPCAPKNPCAPVKQ